MKSLFIHKPQYRIEVGGFIASFYFKENDIKNTYLQIDTISGIWSMRLDGRTYPFGYLYAAASQDNKGQIHGYAAFMYRTAMALTQSQGFVDGLTKELSKLDRRLMKEAEQKMKQISPEMEQGEIAFMESVIERSQMSKKEAKKASEEDKAILRELLKEDKEGEE